MISWPSISPVNWPLASNPCHSAQLSLIICAMLRRILTLMVLLMPLPSLAVEPAAETIAEHGIVATTHPLAAQIGLEILKQGGNAVDAAIATNAAMGLMEPMSCGLGGDLYAIVWDAKSQ